MFSKNAGFSDIIAVMGLLFSCLVTEITPRIENQSLVAKTFVSVDTVKADPFLENLFKQYPQYFDSILKYRKAWNVQVIYTQVDRGANGIPIVQDHLFNVDTTHYFYPASTIKLPVVILALQRLNELKEKGIDKNSTMLTGTAFIGQTAVYNDPTTPDGRPNIAHYIKKILMASDNDAYNRLYEFLGQEYINTELDKKGYTDAQVLHRLDIFLTEEENRNTNPVTFRDSNNQVVYEQPGQRSNLKYLQRKDSIGHGYYKDGQLIRSPMNFSAKNRISLPDLHRMLISLVFPNKVPGNQRFNITDTDK